MQWLLYLYGIEEHGCMIAAMWIFGLVLGEDIIGFGNRDAEQWMEKMLKDFPLYCRRRTAMSDGKIHIRPEGNSR